MYVNVFYGLCISILILSLSVRTFYLSIRETCYVNNIFMNFSNYSSSSINCHHDYAAWWTGSLTASVFPKPVCAIPTMSLPVRATGKPWDWIAVGSLKFCCISTSITYSARKRRVTVNKIVKLLDFLPFSHSLKIFSSCKLSTSPGKTHFTKCLNWLWLQNKNDILKMLEWVNELFIVYANVCQRWFVQTCCNVWFTNEETAPDEKRWSPLNIQSLWWWSPSSCETLPFHTGYVSKTGKKEKTYIWTWCINYSYFLENFLLKLVKKYDYEAWLYFMIYLRNIKIYLTHMLDLRVFSVEVLLKFWQLVQVPPLLAETLTWIPKLHRWGPAATAHGPKPWPER